MDVDDSSSSSGGGGGGGVNDKHDDDEIAVHHDENVDMENNSEMISSVIQNHEKGDVHQQKMLMDVDNSGDNSGVDIRRRKNEKTKDAKPVMLSVVTDSLSITDLIADTEELLGSIDASPIPQPSAPPLSSDDAYHRNNQSATSTSAVTSPVGSSSDRQKDVDYSGGGWKDVNVVLRRNGFSEVTVDDSGEVDVDGMFELFSDVLNGYEKRGRLVKEAAQRMRSDEVGDDEDIVSENRRLRGKVVHLDKKLAAYDTLEKSWQRDKDAMERAHLTEKRQFRQKIGKLQQKLVFAKQHIQENEQRSELVRTQMEKRIRACDKAKEDAEKTFRTMMKRPMRRSSPNDEIMVQLLRVFRDQQLEKEQEVVSLCAQVKSLNSIIADYENHGSRESSVRIDGDSTTVGAAAAAADMNGSTDLLDDKSLLMAEELRERRLKRQLGDVRAEFERRERMYVRHLSDAESEIAAHQEKVKKLEARVGVLEADLDSRPSVTQWNECRQELETLQKKFSHTQTLRDLSKYVDTRELIRRDRELHQLGLRKFEHLPQSVAVELLQDVCRELQLTDVGDILPSIRKMGLVVSAVPGMEQFIHRVSQTVLSVSQVIGAHSKRVSPPKSIGELLEQVVPTLRSWESLFLTLTSDQDFRVRVRNELCRRVSFDAHSSDTDHGNELAQIRDLVKAEAHAVRSRKAFEATDEYVASNPHEIAHQFIDQFQRLFQVENGMEGMMPRLNQVYLRYNEMVNTLHSLASTLNMDPNTNPSHMVAAIQQYVEKATATTASTAERDTNVTPVSVAAHYREMVKDLRTLLGTATDDMIVPTCEELVEQIRTYNELLPKFDGMLSQLYNELDVSTLEAVVPELRKRLRTRTQTQSSNIVSDHDDDDDTDDVMRMLEKSQAHHTFSSLSDDE